MTLGTMRTLGTAFLALSGTAQALSSMSQLRDQTTQMFYHGWNSYLKYGLPDDEVRPLTCTPNTGDYSNPFDFSRNDMLGGYALTMLDTLDMFAMMNETAKFHKYIDYIEHEVSFDVPSTVQVFETTIRAMGGLLSGHLYASVSRLGQTKPDYNGRLLELAYDLGERLLPAFNSTSGIPHPRVNLRHGLVPIGDKYITETCASGAGSLLLEFALLSRLTGDSRFETAARKAFFELWARRSDLDLVAMSIDSDGGKVTSPITGNGASIDSLYEYALKYYVLFGDAQFYSIFDRIYKSLQTYSFDGWLYANINFNSGTSMTSWIDALAAFFPGLLVLGGHVQEAIQNHLAYYKLWSTFGGIPERWNYGRANKENRELLFLNTGKVITDPIDLEWYPLRPEFIESNYYLHRATRDPFYVQVGEAIINDLQTINRAKCGYAGIQDIRTGELQNRMETFFLSETTKYLYLLFSPDHMLNNEFSNFVFSTEAHPFWYDQEVLDSASASRFPMVAERVFESQQQWAASIALREDGNKSILTKIRETFWKPSTQAHGSRRKPSKQGSVRYENEPQCRAWQHHDDLTSLVASWNQFYHLDHLYDYMSPPWLVEKFNGTRRPIEFYKDFYSDFVDIDAVCKVPKKEPILELVFPLPMGVRKSQLLVKSDVIEATNLNGLKLRLTRTIDDEEEHLKVLLMDSVAVEDKIIQVAEFDSEGSIVDILPDGTMLIQGERVINVHIAK